LTRAGRHGHRVFKYIGGVIENYRICVKLMSYLWGNGSPHHRPYGSPDTSGAVPKKQ